MVDKKRSIRPIVLFGYSVIFVTFGVLGVWASLAKLDSAVVAPGTIALDGNRKVIQHLEGGIVAEILVEEADTVVKGDILVILRDVEARSNLEVLETRLDVARISGARVLAERRLLDSFTVPEGIDLDDPDVERIIENQRSILENRKALLKSQLEIQDNSLEGINNQIKGLEMQRSALEKRRTNYSILIQRMTRGLESGAIQKNVLAMRQDEFIQIEVELGRVISQLGQAQSSVGEIKLQALQAEQRFRERAHAELKEIWGEVSELMERVKISRDILKRTIIVSPGEGTIQDLKIHTVGSVIRPGEILMQLIPEDDTLVIDVRVSPIDIDNVMVGLVTEVRFTAFKSRLTPIVLGEVESVSRDVITPSSPNELPYYLARVKVDEADIDPDIRERLTPGMPADAIIMHGERSVATYLISPLSDAVRKSLLED